MLALRRSEMLHSSRERPARCSATALSACGSSLPACASRPIAASNCCASKASNQARNRASSRGASCSTAFSMSSVVVTAEMYSICARGTKARNGAQGMARALREIHHLRKPRLTGFASSFALRASEDRLSFGRQVARPILQAGYCASAANLKSLYCKRQIRLRNFKSRCGTGLTFES
jgi:hypothetical protein